MFHTIYLSNSLLTLKGRKERGKEGRKEGREGGREGEGEGEKGRKEGREGGREGGKKCSVGTGYSRSIQPPNLNPANISPTYLYENKLNLSNVSSFTAYAVVISAQ